VHFRDPRSPSAERDTYPVPSSPIRPGAPVRARSLTTHLSVRAACNPADEDVMIDPDELAYDAATFPPGCFCTDCRRPFQDGDRYSQRLLSVSEGVTLVEVVCLRCALAPLDAGT
jgi:hypothetical protein